MATLALLLRNLLLNPTSEEVKKRQILQIAEDNLHQPEIVSVLLECLPVVDDPETKRTLLDMLFGIDDSRLGDLGTFYQMLSGVFSREGDFEIRLLTLRRIIQGLGKDDQVTIALIEALTVRELKDTERELIALALSRLPTVSESTASLALAKGLKSPAQTAAYALQIAQRVPVWGNELVAALTQYLVPSTGLEIRLTILEKLAQTKKLSPHHLLALSEILMKEPNVQARFRALKLLASVHPPSIELLEQLLWTAANDGEAGVRTRALALQAELPTFNQEQLKDLLQRLVSDRSSGVRVMILEILKNYSRAPEVRSAVLESFLGSPSAFEDQEFQGVITILAPYLSRDERLREGLLQVLPKLNQVAQRRLLFREVLSHVSLDTVIPTLLRLFKDERDQQLRASMFGFIRPLSLIKYPQLKQALSAELIDPSSSFRLPAAIALAAVGGDDPETTSAFEDVLVNDQDPELLRTCLEGYLRGGGTSRFEPLISVVKNEGIGLGPRQIALDALLKLKLEVNQQSELASLLSGSTAAALKGRP